MRSPVRWPRDRARPSHGRARGCSSPTLVLPDAGGSETGSLSLDLRVNDIGVHPYPGLPSRLAPLLQTARGLQDAFSRRLHCGPRGGRSGGVRRRGARGGGAGGGAAARGASRRDDRRSRSAGGGRASGSDEPGGWLRGRAAGAAVELELEERWAWLRWTPRRAVLAITEGGEHQGITQYTLGVQHRPERQDGAGRRGDRRCDHDGVHRRGRHPLSTGAPAMRWWRTWRSV